MKWLDKLIGLFGRRRARAADARAYSEAAIVLAAKLAKVDGPITRAEIDRFKSVFQIDPAEVKAVGRIWRSAKDNARGFEPYARKIGALYADQPKILESMVAALFEVARADGSLKSAEVAYLERVARSLGLARGAFARLRAQAEKVAGDPYAVLGLHPGADDDEVKHAWYRLLRVYHPDAVIGQGKSHRLIAIATEKTAAINAAYEAIQRERVVAA
jgi:DnaJ like chaperone protein